MTNYAQDYKESTDAFLALVATLSPSDLDRADAEGWTPRQVIHHLADSEAQSYARLRRLIAEPGSVIQGYDENKWAEALTLGYTTEGIEDALAVFKAVRQSSYTLIQRLSPEQLDNAGIHTESGPYSVRKWLSVYTNHPLDHAEQIRQQLTSN